MDRFTPKNLLTLDQGLGGRIMNSKLYLPALVALLGVTITSCQGDQGSSRGKRSSNSGWASVDFEAGNAEHDQNSLSLADGDDAQPVVAYKLQVECDDVEAMDVEAAPFEIPIGAVNCVAKLKSIKVGEKNYIEAAGGSGFTKYAVNEVGKFVNDKDANDQLYVRVKKQLPSPLKADATVEYDYSNVQAFETVVGTRDGVDNVVGSSGAKAPEIKVASAKLLASALNLKLICKDAAGFVGTEMNQMECAKVAVKDMKIAVKTRKDETTPKKAELSSAISESGVLFKDLPSTIDRSSQLGINITGLADSKVYLVVIANQDSYSYGFVRMNADSLAANPVCVPQGDRANFVLLATNTTTGRGRWQDTANCNVWVRPSMEKVTAGQRFKLCPAANADEPAGKRLLPYGADMKAAYDRNIKDLVFGDAPKLGAQTTTFWMAGGRVFNMATGTFRSAKDIKPGEKHGVVCFVKFK
jgi:hypothetical protein